MSSDPLLAFCNFREQWPWSLHKYDGEISHLLSLKLVLSSRVFYPCLPCSKLQPMIRHPYTFCALKHIFWISGRFAPVQSNSWIWMVFENYSNSYLILLKLIAHSGMLHVIASPSSYSSNTLLNRESHLRVYSQPCSKCGSCTWRGPHLGVRETCGKLESLHFSANDHTGLLTSSVFNILFTRFSLAFLLF